MSKPSDLGSLKIGSYILLPHTDQPSGEACRIIEYDTSKPGKHGAAKARIVGHVSLMEKSTTCWPCEYANSHSND